MTDNLRNFTRTLQKQIFEETKMAYEMAAFERWRNPLYMGAMDNPDGYARVTGPCDDTMEIFLKFEKDRVVEASFQTDGCGSSAVCGSFAAEMAIGKTPDEILDVTGDAILERLGGLPKDEDHCAFLAGETLQEAIGNYMIKQIKTMKGGIRKP